jgi:PKD repeat protein
MDINPLIKKGFAIGIILLFVGTGIIPATARLIEKDYCLSNDGQIIVNDGEVNKIVFAPNSGVYNGYTPLDDGCYQEIVKREHHSRVTLNKYDINFTNPLNNDVLRAGDMISINGTITGVNFMYYVVEYGQGAEPTVWHTTGITLINGGTAPIVNDMVAIWNTSHITEPDFFTLRITTHYSGNMSTPVLEKQPVFLQNIPFSLPMNNHEGKTMPVLDEVVTSYIKNLYLDPTLKEGWPQRLYEYCEDGNNYWWGGFAEPVVSDVDNDGIMEIFVFLNHEPPKIYAFHPDGSNVDGWPVELENEHVRGRTASPSIADIDQDGYKEIIINAKEGLYVYDHNGSFRKFIALYDSAEPSVDTMLADLDGDGNLEIIKVYTEHSEYPGDFSGKSVAVFDLDGTMLPGWPQRVYNHSVPSGYYIAGATGESVPAVGNFDDDSELEIVVGCCRNIIADQPFAEGRVYVFNHDGSILNGYPVNVDGRIFSSPAVGDINIDGYDEIIFGSYQSKFPDFGLYALDRFGNNVTGWPQLVGETCGILTSPALADFNGDGYLEIVASTIGYPFKTYIFNYQGNILSGWPQQTSWNDYRSPIVGDVNGDGCLDVLTTAGNGVNPDHLGDGGVYAWNLDGTLIDGFPKVTEVDAQAAATITDIDDDGMVELLASSTWEWDYGTGLMKNRDSIYIWELNTVFNKSTMEWPMFHHDPQHTGWYEFGPRELKAYAKGPYWGLINQPVLFSGAAKGGDPPYSWHWDFGDEGVSGQQNPTYNYTSAGNYTISFTVMDNSGNTSDDITWAKIKQTNNPPDKPSITGPTRGKIETVYNYTFTSVDPDGGDLVYYYIDWGDDTTTSWVGPYISGTEATISHKWKEKGFYVIRAKARDNYGSESDWGQLVIRMPFVYNAAFGMRISQLFERFPHAFPILRHLLGY